ncbi:MAG: YegS/Rv2252/BmrU family lipid kinase [Ruminococcaceae bacterium]|nr:YegS/Rv2252/BmrU family lipid kinase [Oscillospiraceae bacterium]
MKHCFIINPASGKANTKEGLEDKIRAACERAEAEYDVLYTKSQGDAACLIKEYFEANADGELRFYACGGDGTLCEVATAVMSLDDRARVSVGVVPVGTGNDFVKVFSGKESFLDMDAQLAATSVAIDLIKCNDIYAVNMINIGFDSEVVVKTADIKKKKFIPSKLAYICGLIATLIKKPGVEMDVSINGGEPEHKKLLLTTFANGQFCGGGFHSNPRSGLRDGVIDTLFIQDVPRIKFISMVGDYKNGTHLVDKYKKIIEHLRESEYDMVFSKPTNVSVDGEIIKMDSAHISVERDALNILVPRGARCESLVEKAEEVLI